jgi:hypothetical protein
MLHLKADEWKGNVAKVERLPEQFYEQYYDPKQLVGKQVDIDGVVYTVAAAETYAVSTSIDYPNYFSVDIAVIGS